MIRFLNVLFAVVIAAPTFATVGDKRGTFECPGCCKNDHVRFSECSACDMTGHLRSCPRHG